MFTYSSEPEQAQASLLWYGGVEYNQWTGPLTRLLDWHDLSCIKNHLYTCSTPAQVPISSLPQPCPKNDPASILADYFGTLCSRSPQFGAKCVVVWYRVLDVALPVGSHLVLLWGGLMRIALAQFSSSSPYILCTVPAYYNVDSGHSHTHAYTPNLELQLGLWSHAQWM